MSKPKPRFQPGDRVMIYKPGADEHGATATVEKVIPGAEYDPADADGWDYVPTAPWCHRDGEYNSYHKGPLPDRMVTGAPAAKPEPKQEYQHQCVKCGLYQSPKAAEDMRCTCFLPEAPAAEPEPEEEYQCRCGYRFEYALGAYGCANCEGSEGPAELTTKGTPSRTEVLEFWVHGWRAARIKLRNKRAFDRYQIAHHRRAVHRRKICPGCGTTHEDDWPITVQGEIKEGGCQECWEKE